jgi:hypothetical protein
MPEAKPETVYFDINHPVQLAFPNLFIPKRSKNRDGKETGDPHYSTSFVIKNDSPALIDLKRACVAVAKAKWPSLTSEDLKTKIAWPWTDGQVMADKRRKDKGKDDNDWMIGSTVVKSKSKFPVNVSIVENGKVRENIQNDPLAAVLKDKFYNGADAFATVNLVAYTASRDGDKDGVTVYLHGVLGLGTGEKHGGSGVSMGDRFRDVVGSYSAEDPTAGDDEIPF